MGYDGRIIMVTGGSGGIGRAVVDRLVADGAHVVIADLDRAAAEPALGDDVSFVELNVSSDVAWGRAMAEVTAKGELVGLVNAAGIFLPGVPFTEMSLDTWRRHFAVNLDGTFLGCQHGIRAMAGKGGSIVNFSSGLAEIILTDGAAYCVSKAGVVALTRVAAKAGAKGKVRVNAVLPGAIETDMMWRNLRDGMTRQDLVDMLLPQHPIGRLGVPDDVAHCVAFLLDPQASFVTGASLAVDGGQLLG